MNSGAVSLELPGLFPEAGAGEQHMELCVMIPSVLLRGLCEQVHKGVSCADTKFYGGATMGILFTLWPLLKFIISVAACQLTCLWLQSRVLRGIKK